MDRNRKEFDIRDAYFVRLNNFLQQAMPRLKARSRDLRQRSSLTRTGTHLRSELKGQRDLLNGEKLPRIHQSYHSTDWILNPKESESPSIIY